MKDIIFNGPFSMPIMEDSTTLSETVVGEVFNFAREQYGIEIDHINFSISGQYDLDHNPNRHKSRTIQKLTIRKKGDKINAHLVIKSSLECE